MNKIPPFRIDPLGSEKSEEGNLSKNGHHHQNSAPSSPAVDPVVVSSPKSKKRKLPMSDSNDSTNKSPKSSTPSPARDCHFLFECSLYFDIKFELFKAEQNDYPCQSETISAPPPAPPHHPNHVNSPNKPVPTLLISVFSRYNETHVKRLKLTYQT